MGFDASLRQFSKTPPCSGRFRRSQTGFLVGCERGRQGRAPTRNREHRSPPELLRKLPLPRPYSLLSVPFARDPDESSADQVFPPRYRLFALCETRHEGYPEGAVAARTERGARRDDYALFE